MNAISPVLPPSANLSSGSTTQDAALMRLGSMLDHFIAREEEAWSRVPDDCAEDHPIQAEAEKRSNDTAVIA